MRCIAGVKPFYLGGGDGRQIFQNVKVFNSVLRGGSEIRQDLRAGSVPLNKHARPWADQGPS
jgi:hypothetical protein